MPRLPDPKSKTPQLTVRAINDKDAEMFRKLKEICREKGITIASKLRPEIERIVKEEWPPNPQLQMGQFTGQLPLSLETARKLEGRQRIVTCQDCRGTGQKLGLKCYQCNGVGKYTEE